MARAAKVYYDLTIIQQPQVGQIASENTAGGIYPTPIVQLRTCDADGNESRIKPNEQFIMQALLVDSNGTIQELIDESQLRRALGGNSFSTAHHTEDPRVYVLCFHRSCQRSWSLSITVSTRDASHIASIADIRRVMNGIHQFHRHLERLSKYYISLNKSFMPPKRKIISDSEEEWLNELQQDDYNEEMVTLKTNQVVSTARQRALLGDDEEEEELVELLEKPRKKSLNAEEAALKKSETSRKRKHHMAKKLEEEKQSTIDKLLKKQTSKRLKKNDDTVELELLPTKIRYVDSVHMPYATLSFPK